MPEPTLIEQPRVAAEAMLGEKGPVIGPRTNEQLMADRLREEVSKDIEPRKITESIAPHPAPNPGEIHHINEENFGTQRIDAGPQAGEKDYTNEPRSKEFRNRAEVSSRIAREILDRGYDGLTNDPRDGSVREPRTAQQKQRMLVDACMRAVRNWQEGRQIFENLTPEQQRARVEELFLRNPRALKILSERFGEVYNDANILKDEMGLAQDEFEKADKINNAKAEALQSLKDRLQKIEDGEKRFLPGTMDYDALIRLRGESGSWEGQLAAKLAELEKLDRDLKAAYPKVEKINIDETQTTDPNNPNKILTNKRPVSSIDQGLATQIQKAESRMDQLRREMATIQQQQAKLKGFEDEINRLNKERQDLKIAEAPLIEEAAKAELDWKEAKRKLDVARAKRAVDEERFANEATGMFQEAAVRYMEQEAKRYEAAQAKISKEAIANATKGDEEHIQKAMKNKWRKDEKKGRRTVSKVNKSEIRAAYDQMIKEGSAESFVKKFMGQGVIDARTKYGAGSIQEQEEQRRLNDRFKDSEFMKKMNAVVAQRLLETYLEAGGKFRKEDITLLNQTEWGDAVIEGALAQNGKSGPAIERLQKENAFQGSKGEFVKAVLRNPNAYKTAGLGAVGILALLLGAPFLIAGGTVAGALYEKGVEAAFAGSGAALGALS